MAYTIFVLLSNDNDSEVHENFPLYKIPVHGPVLLNTDLFKFFIKQ